MRPLLLAFAFASLGASGALAQSLDGTWVGATPRGSSITVTITSGQATSYYFQNRPQGISGGKVAGNKVTFSVAGRNQGTVMMTRAKGNSAEFRYTDNTGPDAMTTTVTRQ